MTKEEFIDQMFKWVTYYKEKLEEADIYRVQLDKHLIGNNSNITFNPFLKFDEKYFNIKLLSNLQALDMVLYKNSDANVYQIKMFIICNQQFKVLNQVLKHSPYMVEELKEKTHSPMDIAIAYARYCELQDRYQNTTKR